MKKALSFLLSIIMVLSMSLTVFAADGDVAKVGDTTYATLAEAVAAVDSTNNVITLLDDVTVEAGKGGYSKAGLVLPVGATLDGAGHTLTVTGANGTWDCGIYTTGGTIQNLTVSGSFRGIFTAGTSADIIIDNVSFNNVIYTFNSDDGSKEYEVIVKNSALNGWTSFSDVHKAVTFIQCTFDEGSGYAFCRPYNDPTYFIDCDFAGGFEFDATQTDNSFENCKYDGKPLTQDNITELAPGWVNGDDEDKITYDKVEPEEEAPIVVEEEEEDEEEYVSVTAKILWEGRAVSDGVEVKLLKNDKKYETKTLTSGKYKINNWRYTWSELDPEDDWTIEVIVPDGYECDIDEYGDNDFEITLTQIKTAASDTVEELNPNTGAI